ncbi:hypothetical protein L798_14215 [Zootermopsis nevadensis]|uniref:Uncharacterized protein n=1 Tax=Zootermopsis nevadensis TaxID=136037 RepID=A0A067RR13_ZOONE|nr:hypothetical protein L798_14215 [Zootermopsis nevadensis]
MPPFRPELFILSISASIPIRLHLRMKKTLPTHYAINNGENVVKTATF